MKHMLYIRLLWFCILTLPTVAQDVKLTATINKSTVALNEQFQITFTINANASQFTPPPLNSFHVLSGPNQSTSMQVINGKMSQSVSLSYILQPKQEGKFEIAPAHVMVGNTKVSSNSITLSVVKATSNNKAGNSNSQQDKTVQGGANVFIKASVSKSNIYIGEGISISYKIYTNVDIINYGINKMPAVNGFYSQEVNLPDQLQLTNEVIDGVNYKVGEIKRMILFPQQSGTLSIDKMEGECIARVKVKGNRGNPNDPFSIFNDPFFNDPFFGFGNVRDVKVAIESNPIKIQVKPLPDPKPISFNGSVGKISFQASVDKNTLKTNEALTLQLRFSGNGNLKLIEAPKPDINTDFEIYDPKITDKISTNSSVMSGSIVYDYLLIPRVPGEYTIPTIEFTYFNPDSRTYITEKQGPFVIQVEKGEGTMSAVSQTTKSDFKELGRDIKYLKTNYQAGSAVISTIVHNGAYFLPYILFASLLVFRRKQLKERSDLQQFRSKKAGKTARKKLSFALAEKSNLNQKVFYVEILKAMYGFIADRYKVNRADLSRDTVDKMLLSGGASENLIISYKQVIDECEMIQYGMYTDSIEKRNEIYELASEVIIKTDQELRRS